jgi:putative phosphoesterase
MPSPSRSFSVGLISDTHGLLRPEALEALRGSRYIVHAGDIGDPAILEALSRLAPVTAVRGNNDTGPWARRLRDTALLEAGGVRIYVLHDLKALEVDPGAEGFQAVVAGHSHKPAESRRNGVLYVNPGSAGPRRFSLPVSVGRLRVTPKGIRVRFTTLGPK